MNHSVTPDDEIVAPIPTIQHPPEARTVYLGGIFFILMFAVFYEARAIILPIILAFMLKLVLQPVSRFLQRFNIPKLPSSILILLLLTSGVVGLGTALSGPASDWIEKLPAGVSKAQQQLVFLSKPIENAEKFIARADSFTQGKETLHAVALPGTKLSDRIFNGIKTFAGELLTTLLVLFFLLASGDTFLRRLVEVLPRFKDKRQAVDISQQIEQQISRYLVTITMMNIGVGVLTGLTMEFCGVGEPLLWGTLAVLLNYIPIVGPLIGVGIFLLAGMLTANIESSAFLPAAIYFLIHVTESTFVTPMLLAKRFTLNPVLVIISLIFWFWIWGVPGAILSMPMLAILKIICDRIEPLKALGHFLEG